MQCWHETPASKPSFASIKTMLEGLKGAPAGGKRPRAPASLKPDANAPGLAEEGAFVMHVNPLFSRGPEGQARNASVLNESRL